MNEDVIVDLKQFIATTISQQTSDIREDIGDIREDIGDIRGDIGDIRNDIKKLDEKLSKRIDDLDQKLDTVMETVGERNEETHAQFKNHEKRIRKLEAKTA
jgi:chromosome segregation ATPase